MTNKEIAMEVRITLDRLGVLLLVLVLYGFVSRPFGWWFPDPVLAVAASLILRVREVLRKYGG